MLFKGLKAPMADGWLSTVNDAPAAGRNPPEALACKLAG